MRTKDKAVCPCDEESLHAFFCTPVSEERYFAGKGLNLLNNKGVPFNKPDPSELQAKLVQRLRNPRYNCDQMLAEKLANCVPYNRCASAACYDCGRAFQHVVTKAAARFIKEENIELAIISIVPLLRVYAGHFAVNPEIYFDTFKSQLDTFFNKAEIPIVFGGMDISANEHEENNFLPHYKIHFWGFIERKHIEGFKKVASEHFSKSESVPKPWRISAYDGRANALAYMLKFQFKRRVTLAKIKQDSGTHKTQKPSERGLTAAQSVEIARALDRVGLSNRFYSRGITLVQQDRGLKLINNNTKKGKNRD